MSNSLESERMMVPIDIYRAQVVNVRQLEHAWKMQNRALNHSLRRGDLHSVTVQTHLLGLLFCAWAEANFLKLLYTPYGFTEVVIAQVKQTVKQNGIAFGWKKCLELGLLRVEQGPKTNFVPNARQSVEKLIDDYVERPSLVRNKIAHGQWKVALNRENTAVNLDATAALNALDCVMLYKWKIAHTNLAAIIETLIESPRKAFHRDYWQHIAALQVEIERTGNWTLADKIQKLQAKPIHMIAAV